MKYFLILILLYSCSSLDIKNTISKDEFCEKNKIKADCDVIYSYYLANHTLLKQNESLDKFILQHQP